IGAYSYDPVGRRAEKTASGATTEYAYAGVDVIAEYNGSGTLLRRIVPGGAIDAPIAFYDEDAPNDPIFYLHYDGQGSVIGVSDSTGANTEKYTYGPFGETPVTTGSPYHYVARRIDQETGLYYVRARYYSPEIGRFLSPDPIGYGDGLNMYAYVRNDPVNLTDPSGLGVRIGGISNFRTHDGNGKAIPPVGAGVSSGGGKRGQIPIVCSVAGGTEQCTRGTSLGSAINSTADLIRSLPPGSVRIGNVNSGSFVGFIEVLEAILALTPGASDGGASSGSGDEGSDPLEEIEILANPRARFTIDSALGRVFQQVRFSAEIGGPFYSLDWSQKELGAVVRCSQDGVSCQVGDTSTDVPRGSEFQSTGFFGFTGALGDIEGASAIVVVLPSIAELDDTRISRFRRISIRTGAPVFVGLTIRRFSGKVFIFNGPSGPIPYRN
ncbi:MAG: RHS repeat-associated core domain-containing protein, partial [Sphingomonadales bacterium]|nr:RHS repeat-associated core domain-containing protein [Sphingomonadales bacterium]